MTKKNRDYFVLLKKQMSCCIEAAGLLETLLSGTSAADADACRGRVRGLGAAAAALYQDILRGLSTEFITPIDQEDILRLSQSVAELMDALAKAFVDVQIYHIGQLPEHSAELSRSMAACVYALLEAMEELKNFKKPELLRAKLLRVKVRRSEAEDIYTDAVCALFARMKDCRLLLGSKALYDSLQSCCVLCGRTAALMEQIIIKNT